MHLRFCQCTENHGSYSPQHQCPSCLMEKWRQNVAQVIRGFSVRSDQTISIRLLGKPSNITNIQVYAPTTEAEEDESCYQVSKKKVFTHQNKTH